MSWAASCSKESTPGRAASSSAVPHTTATPPGSAAPAGSAAAAPAASAGSDWSGSYAAKVGAVVPPEAAHEKTWTQDPGKSAIGAGTIELAVDKSGVALGQAKG